MSICAQHWIWYSLKHSQAKLDNGPIRVKIHFNKYQEQHLIYINKACQHYLNWSVERIPSGQASDWLVAHC